MPRERYTLTRPLPTDVQCFWEVIDKERAAMYAPPPSLGALVEAWGRTMLLFLGAVHGSPAALFVIRDPRFCATTGTPQTGWITAVVLPGFRGAPALRLAALALEKAAGWGFHTFWTGCLARNRAARHFAVQCGFRPCGAVAGLVSTAEHVHFYAWHPHGGEHTHARG